MAIAVEKSEGTVTSFTVHKVDPQQSIFLTTLGVGKLAEILTNLGQGHIVRSIDSELRMRPEFVQWERERDIRSKGQTF